MSPVSRDYGLDRGTPIDRFYIERFLENHRSDIRGRVLEVKDGSYTRRFGGDRVFRSDVVDVWVGNPNATILGDLTKPTSLPSDVFDCEIVTQTIHLLYDAEAAVRTLHQALRPGGVLLATLPGICKRSGPGGEEPDDLFDDFWRFTRASASRLFSTVFGDGQVSVEGHGNVLSAIGFLHGLAQEELRQVELDHHDPDYELVITIRAVKRAI